MNRTVASTTRQASSWNLQEKRRRDRPRNTWRRDLPADTQRMGITWNKWKQRHRIRGSGGLSSTAYTSGVEGRRGDDRLNYVNVLDILRQIWSTECLEGARFDDSDESGRISVLNKNNQRYSCPTKIDPGLKLLHRLPTSNTPISSDRHYNQSNNISSIYLLSTIWSSCSSLRLGSVLLTQQKVLAMTLAMAGRTPCKK